MARRRNNRRFKRSRSRRRRSSLSASNWGPILALGLTVAGILGLAALIVFVALPKLLPLFGVEYRAPFAPTPTPTPIATPVPTPYPMENYDPESALNEVVFTGYTDYTWFGDPYFYNDVMIFSAGKLVESNAVMGDLYYYYPGGREAEHLNYSLRNTHFMYARFNDKWLVYLDANLNGGGYIMAVNLQEDNARPKIVKEIYTGQPEPMLDGDYLAWTDRTGTNMDKLFVCDLSTMETTTMVMFSNSVYGQSKPSLRNGTLLWADSDTDSADIQGSVIKYLHLHDSTVESYSPGTFVHNPQSDGKYTAWVTGFYGPDDNDLYYSYNFGTAKLIANGIVDYGLGDGFIAYCKDEAIYAYVFETDKEYRVTPERESVQFLGVSDGNKVCWMDVTSRDRDIMKFAELPIP